MSLKYNECRHGLAITATLALLGFLVLIAPCETRAEHKKPVVLIGSIHRSVGEGQTMGCEKITLQPRDVIRYFSTATEVSFSTFHYESVILPCAFSGKLRRNGVTYGWSINAAGAGYLYPENGSDNLFFLCRRSCEKALPGLMGL